MKRSRLLSLIILQIFITISSQSYAKSNPRYGVKSTSKAKISLKLTTNLSVESKTKIHNHSQGQKIQENIFCINRNNSANYKIFTSDNHNNSYSIEWLDKKLENNQESIISFKNQGNNNCQDKTSSHAKVRVTANDNKKLTEQDNKTITINFAPV